MSGSAVYRAGMLRGETDAVAGYRPADDSTLHDALTTITRDFTQ